MSQEEVDQIRGEPNDLRQLIEEMKNGASDVENESESAKNVA
jgi:hypothetical protein